MIYLFLVANSNVNINCNSEFFNNIRTIDINIYLKQVLVAFVLTYSTIFFLHRYSSSCIKVKDTKTKDI